MLLRQVLVLAVVAVVYAATVDKDSTVSSFIENIGSYLMLVVPAALAVRYLQQHPEKMAGKSRVGDDGTRFSCFKALQHRLLTLPLPSQVLAPFSLQRGSVSWAASQPTWWTRLTNPRPSRRAPRPTLNLGWVGKNRHQR